MSNFISVILVIAMLFSTLGGMLPAESVPANMEISAAVELDPAFLPANEAQDETAAAAQQQMVAGLLDFVNKLTIRAGLTESAGELSILQSGTPLVSLASRQKDGGVEIVSSLFPAYKATVAPETLQKLQSQLAAQMPANAGGTTMDAGAVAAIVNAPLEKFTAALQEKAGEPEEGSFVVEGIEFTQKIPCNITTKELMTLVIALAKEITANETVASALSSANVDLSQMDSFLEELQEKDDSELPVTEAAAYAGEGDLSGVSVRMTKDEQSIDFFTCKSGSAVKVLVNALNQATLELNADAEAQQLALTVAFKASPVEGTVDLAVTKEGVDLAVALQKDGAPATVALQFKPVQGDAITADFDKEGLTVVPVEEVMTAAAPEPAEDGTVTMTPAQSFQQAFSMGLMTLLFSTPLATIITPAMQ